MVRRFEDFSSARRFIFLSKKSRHFFRGILKHGGCPPPPTCFLGMEAWTQSSPRRSTTWAGRLRLQGLSGQPAFLEWDAIAVHGRRPGTTTPPTQAFHTGADVSAASPGFAAPHAAGERPVACASRTVAAPRT